MVGIQERRFGRFGQFVYSLGCFSNVPGGTLSLRGIPFWGIGRHAKASGIQCFNVTTPREPEVNMTPDGIGTPWWRGPKEALEAD